MKENNVYMLVALRRNKDKENENLSPLCRRHLVTGDYNENLSELKERCHEPGLWRIYRSVNKRDLTKAMKKLQIELIENGENIKDNISSKWKSILMKSNCKSEKGWLIDIDTKDSKLYNEVVSYLENNTEVSEIKETPNGYHVIVKPFDSREFHKLYVSEEVCIKKDALIFVEMYKN